MKKLIKCTLLMLLMLSNYSCDNARDISFSVEDSNEINHYEEEITKDNLWYYFDYDISSGLKANSDEVLDASFYGVLTFALYNNVVITFDLKYEVGEEILVEQHEFKLKANGNGYFSLSSYYVTSNGEGVKLLSVNRSLEINKVEGKVVYFI